ncbi:MAG: DsbA family protein [Gemmatimonadaceae bacterium]
MTRSLALTALSLSLVGALGCPRPGDAPDTARQPAAPAASDTLVSRADAARIQGSPSAPIWVVEVSDFQCPFCKTWHEEVYDAFVREFVTPGTVRLAYINYPLPSHPNAMPAAEAAMCAGAQGKFWEMHDGIFEGQHAWAHVPNASAAFDSIAQSRGVDVAAMRRCIESGVVRSLIQADVERAQETGVQGTPSFLIGGDVLLRGMQPLENFRRAIAEKLGARAGPTP